ncbi:aldose 1-epimerase family protein [Ligilactobacillus murinus]|uniref:aldose 1-epimerase family protein n=1 Tax=Ligilactobacillus murinus TaxID=1622 RepID=UPI001C8BECF7|nr:aldose 1-epimerase family protein [Ligilactobacillus murinus]MBX9012355.1 aldose 1-epimerase family protein [Ligilactobacillus murinus]
MAVMLENETLRIVINEHGAELASLISKENGFEYMWSGDSKYWKRHSAVLFPIEGRLKADTYQVDGTSYHLTQHGFARDMDFEILHQAPTEVCFELRSNEQTLEKYPFEFVLQVQYILTQTKLEVVYRVINPSTKDMYFGLGAHPAFSTKLKATDTYQDYEVRLSPKESYPRIPLVDGFIDLEHITTGAATLPVSHGLFKNDALIYDLAQKPNQVSLVSKQHGHGVTITTTDAKAMGIWSSYPAEGDFVCLEPWWALSDTLDTDGDFKTKYAINKLSGQQVFEANYAIDTF